MKVINIAVFTAILSTVVANMLSQGKFYHCYLQNYKHISSRTYVYIINRIFCVLKYMVFYT